VVLASDQTSRLGWQVGVVFGLQPQHAAESR
jgi:hypothetical protein